MEILLQQYQLLQSSREVLFRYLEGLEPNHYTQDIASFGHGSIRNLQVHVASTYIHWLSRFAMEKGLDYFDAAEVANPSAARKIYSEVDEQVSKFLEAFQGKVAIDITREMRNGRLLTITPLALFTHVLTHEFHHKGQIVSMGRALGYTPVDTDVIRT